MTTTTVNLMKHSGGYFPTPNDIFKRCKDLIDSEKLTLMVLLRHADKDAKCFPSYNTIADLLGKSRITAIRAIKGLVEKGYVEKKHRFEKKFNEFFNKSNEYSINLFKIIGKKPETEVVEEPSTDKKTKSIEEVADEIFNEIKADQSIKAVLKERFLEVAKNSNIGNPKRYIETMLKNYEKEAKRNRSYSNNNRTVKTKLHNFIGASEKYTEDEIFDAWTKDRYSTKKDESSKERKSIRDLSIFQD